MELLGRLQAGAYALKHPKPHLDRKFNSFISPEITQEITDKVNESLSGNLRGFDEASIVVFWIVKLKPFSYTPESQGNIPFPNELLALTLGLGMYFAYANGSLKGIRNVPKSTMEDVAASLRYDDHSPQSILPILKSFF